MPPRAFLSLPHEVRHHIYEAYFTLDNGYAFQPGPGKLAAADGQALDLALMYTCHFIASETSDLPLKYNSVSFSTVYHPEWRRWAGRFDYLLRAQLRMQSHVLIGLKESGHITPNIYAQIGEKYPWFVLGLKFATIMDHRIGDVDTKGYLDTIMFDEEWDLFHTTCCYDFTFEWLKASRYEISQAVKFTLRLVAQELGTCSNPDAIQYMRGWRGDRDGLIDFLDQCYEPWEIPSWSELESMGKRFQDGYLWSRLQYWEFDQWGPGNVAYRTKHHFSAAAVAIRFLNHLSVSKRLSMRKILLCEDRIAVGYQECHSHGLIPFCKENSRLRIEHRASLLTNIFQAANQDVSPYLFMYKAMSSHHEGPNISAGCIFKKFSYWSIEGLAVVDGGMPVDAYSLVFDGEPAIDLCSDIFQYVIQRDAAFYMALERSFPHLLKLHEPTFFSMTGRRAVEALMHLVNQSSILRCNFHPGHLWNVDKFAKAIVDTNEDMKKLYDVLLARDKSGFEPPPYLPSWCDLMMENFERREILTRRERREAGIDQHGPPWNPRMRSQGEGSRSSRIRSWGSRTARGRKRFGRRQNGNRMSGSRNQSR